MGNRGAFLWLPLSLAAFLCFEKATLNHLTKGGTFQSLLFLWFAKLVVTELPLVEMA